MAYNRKSPRRGARPDEVALLQTLLDGAKQLQGGPVGRCMKRGWCRTTQNVLQIDKSSRANIVILYELTDQGRIILAGNASDSISVEKRATQRLNELSITDLQDLHS